MASSTPDDGESAAKTPRRRGRAKSSTFDSDSATGATWDRPQTEGLIERAALELLEKDGVLAGLNLRQVADRAEVNRGLVYLYFGSRQALLRSALMRKADAAPIWDSPRREEQAFAERAVGDLRDLAAEEDQIRLYTLLHLDGVPELEAMPFLDTALQLLERDREAGLIPDDVDAPALHVLLVALGAGYALYRRRFANDLSEEPERLDDRVAEVLGALLTRDGWKPTAE